MVLPHPAIPIAEIRTTDIWLLLAVGAVWELMNRLILLHAKVKPSSILEQQAELERLRHETEYKRKMGPSHFVETSKLERQVLAVEKELATDAEKRQRKVERLESTWKRYGGMILAIVVFLLYYKVPLVTIDAYEQSLGDFVDAAVFTKALMFPLSYVGFGIRASRWGLPSDIASSSIGALVVMWSSQMTVGMLMDAVEAFVL